MKKIISFTLVIIMLLSLLPMTVFAQDADLSDTGYVIYVYNADSLRSALQQEGDFGIKVAEDIEFTMPDGYEWSYLSNSTQYYSYWATVAKGKKTLDLNGKRVYITDNQIEHAKYTTVTHTQAAGSYTYTMEELQPNGYVRLGCMFLIPEGADLTVDGSLPNSEIMFDAQMPAKDQLIDYQVATQRNLFELEGGSLILNGGEYQAGRRKTVYVTSARLKDSDWNNKDGILWPSTHFTGNGEYCIGGSVIYAESGDAEIYGGTLISHGFDYPSSASRNSVLKAYNGNIRMYDGTLKGYCGANAVKLTGDGSIKIYAGESDTEAPNKYLFPYGHHSVSTESNYCAVSCGAGNSYYAGVTVDNEDVKTDNKWDSDDLLTSSKITFSPASHTHGAPIWADGLSENRTVLAGDKARFKYFSEDPYFPSTEGIPAVYHNYEYYFYVARLNEYNKWVDVTDWVNNGSDYLYTLDTTGFESGTYRITAKMVEDWICDRQYQYIVQAEKHMVFTVMKPEDYVISSIDLTVPAPMGNKELNFDTKQVKGLPLYTTCKEIVWYDSNGSIKRSGAIAEPGGLYEIWILLSPEAGRFDSWSNLQNNVTLNGQKAGVTASGDDIWVRYKYLEAGTPTEVDNVEVILKQEPVVGQKPCYDAYYNNFNGFTIEDFDEYPYKDGVAWFRNDGGEMQYNESFRAGHSYTVRISLVPFDDGYEFATSGLSGTLNGREATVAAYYDWHPQDNIFVEYTFTLPEDKKVIKHISLYVPEPVAGEKIDQSAYRDKDAPYTFDSYTSDCWDNGVCWADENGKDIRKDSGAVFEAGKKYTITVSVVPKDEEKYEFAAYDDLAAIVNGYAADIVVYEAKKVVFVMYTFTVSEAPEALKYLLGDADDSQKVNVFDASYIQKAITGTKDYPDYKSIDANSVEFLRADVDDSGTVNIFDASLILRYTTGDKTVEKYGIGETRVA